MVYLTVNRLVRPVCQAQMSTPPAFRFPRHERTAAWPRAEGEETLRNALVRGQASVLLFMAQAA